jgi:LacI family transcriptional regulator
MSNGRTVTIKQIAEVAGVSFSTVAKALRGDPAINQKTRQRVKNIAAELNYYPNSMAKALRSKKTQTIGIILNDLSNPFFSDIYKVIADTLHHKGYSMLLSDSNYDLEIEKKNILMMLSKKVDGIIISPVNENSQNNDLIINSNTKAVFIDITPKNMDVNYVFVNHEKAGYIATNYLLESGHRKILLLNGPKNVSFSEYFLNGHLKSFEKYNVTPDFNLMINCKPNIKCAYDLLLHLWGSSNKKYSIDFTAVLTIGDILAMGIYEAASEIGIKIPEGCSIIGYDNIFSSKYCNPPLTTIHQPKKRIGQQSIEILLKQLSDNTRTHEKIILEPELIVRDSVAILQKSYIKQSNIRKGK